MANRLPLELLHEIILLNDDLFTKEGPVATYMATHRSEYIPEKPKPCAGSIARVCKSWQSYVKNSPRLNLSCFSLFVETGEMEEERDVALREAFDDGILSSTADLDIHIHHKFLESDDMIFAIDRLLCGTVERWRWLGVDGCFNRAHERWAALAAGLSSTPRLKGFYFTGDPRWLASPHQWHAPNLETIEVLDHYEMNESRLLLEPTKALGKILMKAKYSGLMGNIPDDDNANQRVLRLYRMFSSTQHLRLRISEEAKRSTSYIGADILSDCDPDTPEHLFRHLSLSGSERFIVRSLKAFPIQEMPSLSILATGAAIDLPESFETPNLSSLHLSVTFNRLPSILSYVEYQDIKFLDLEIRSEIVENVSLRHALPALLRLRLRTQKRSGLSGTMTFDFRTLNAPRLRELILQGVVKDSTPFSTVKPVLADLRKIVLGGRKQSACFQELAFLSTFDAPALKVLDVKYCDLRFPSSPGVEATENAIKGILEIVEDLRVGDYRELAVLESFIRFTPKLGALQVDIKEVAALEFLKFLATYGDREEMNLPLLTKLEVHILWNADECRAEEVIEGLADAILARRDAGIAEFEHIRLCVSEETQYQQARYSQLSEVIADQTTVEILPYEYVTTLDELY
jgi:hypothetical protein